MGLGLESTAMPVLVISVSVVITYWLGKTSGLQDSRGMPTGGLFGTAVATMGMLSTAGYVLTMDMFGPIADNAGGIVEMSQQVRAFMIFFYIMFFGVMNSLNFCIWVSASLIPVNVMVAATKCSRNHRLAGCRWQHH